MIDPELQMQKKIEEYKKYKYKEQLKQWENNPKVKAWNLKVVDRRAYNFFRIFFYLVLVLGITIALLLIKQDSINSFYASMLNVTK